jgi:hypothetical protein
MGGGSFAGLTTLPRTFIGQAPSVPGLTLTTLNLNNTYSAGTSPGNAISMRLMPLPFADTITKIYFFISSFTGTASLVNDLNWEVRKGTSIPDTTGGGLVGSGSFDPLSTTGWVNTGTISVALTANQGYFIIFGDADGGAVNFAVVGSSFALNPDWYFACQSVSTTTGFTTRNANATAVMAIVLSAGVYGSAVTAYTNGATTNTKEKGLKIPTSLALVAPLKLWGFIADDSQTANTPLTVRLWSGTDGPASGGGGSVVASGTDSVYGVTGNPSNAVGALFSTAPTLQAGTQYRITLQANTTTNAGGILSIGTGVDASLRQTFIGGGWHHTRDSGASAWTDDTNSMAYFSMIVDDLLMDYTGSKINRGIN